MSHTFPSLALAGLVLVPALGLAAPAFADTDAPQIAVRYDDLNLATAKGRHLLDYRLRHSAAVVCGRSDGDRPLPSDFGARHCYDEALNHAHEQLAAVMGHARMASRQ